MKIFQIKRSGKDQTALPNQRGDERGKNCSCGRGSFLIADDAEKSFTLRASRSGCIRCVAQSPYLSYGFMARRLAAVAAATRELSALGTA
jgi:hypothetical protein